MTGLQGYVPAVSNRLVDAPIGLVPVDSLYSPVRQVSYKVDNARGASLTPLTVTTCSAVC